MALITQKSDSEFVPIPVQADTDGKLIELWLHGLSPKTVLAYRKDAEDFARFNRAKPLREVTLPDLQGWADDLRRMAPASQVRKLKAIKSLLGFAHRIGYLTFDVGRPLRVPRLKEKLAERILAEEQIHRMIAMEPLPRNFALLKLVYGCGLRITEAVGLTWRDLSGTKKGGQAAIFGKGGKTRVVLIQGALWRQLAAMRAGAGPDDPVFRSRKGGAIDDSMARRIIKAAAARAGLPREVSPHWLRHGHASHALDHGAPIHVVQQTLGHASLETTTRYVHARPGDSSSNYLPE
jgi:integrase/recombinase XerD